MAKLNKTEVKGIYQEPNGFFVVRITKLDPWSKKTIEKRKRVESFSIQDAIDCKIELVRELKEDLSEGSNTFRDISKAKYKAFIEWYLKHQVSNGIIRKNVEKGDRWVFNNHILPIIGEVKLVSINKRGVFHFIEQLKSLTDKDGIPLAEATYKRAWTLFRASIRFAVKMGFIADDPTHLVAPRFINVKREKEKVALTREQAAILLTEAQKVNHKFYFMTLLGLVSGLRWAEITALQYQDFDFENGVIHIRKSQHKGILNHKVKNGKSHAVPMVEILRLATVEYFSTFGKGKLATDFLFLSKQGNFLNVAGHNRHLKNICTRMGMPLISFHSLRATCNVLYLSAGYSQVVVARILNHSSPQMTLHYNRMQNEQKHEVMQSVWSGVQLKAK